MKEIDEYRKMLEESRHNLDMNQEFIEKLEKSNAQLTDCNQEMAAKDKTLRENVLKKFKEIDEKRKLEEEANKIRCQELEEDIKKKDKRIVQLEKEKAAIQERSESNLEKIKIRTSAEVRAAELKAQDDKERISSKLREAKTYYDKEIQQRNEKIKKLSEEIKELKKAYKTLESENKSLKSPTVAKKATTKRGSRVSGDTSSFQDYLDVIANDAINRQKKAKSTQKKRSRGDCDGRDNNCGEDLLDSDLDDELINTSLEDSLGEESSKRVKINKPIMLDDLGISEL